MRERLLFEPYPKPKRGDENADSIFLEVGRALTSWEMSEGYLARLFAHIVNPTKLQMPVMRAYLLTTSPKNRNDLIKKTGDIFLNYFPSEPAGKLLSEVGAMYKRGAERRNEVAHGVVAGHIDKLPAYSGEYLGPSAFSFSKRDEEFRPKYLYTTVELKLFSKENQHFQSRIRNLTEAVSAAYREGSEVAQARY